MSLIGNIFLNIIAMWYHSWPFTHEIIAHTVGQEHMAQDEYSIRLPVTLLQLGMYVSKLDRPWEGTPFLFQGFPIQSQMRPAIHNYCLSQETSHSRTRLLHHWCPRNLLLPCHTTAVCKHRLTYPTSHHHRKHWLTKTRVNPRTLFSILMNRSTDI